MKKRMTKVLTLLALVLVAAMSLGAVAKADTFSYDPQQLLKDGEGYTAAWFNTDFDGILAAGGLDATEEATYQESATVRKEVGGFISIENGRIIESEDAVKVEETVICENGKAILTFFIDENGELTTWTAEKYATLGEKMARAGLNTLIGISIVFLALIFISLVIVAMGKILSGTTKKAPAPVASTQVAPVPVPAAPAVEEVPADDTELIAVITAAVAAYMESEGEEVPADGLRVRSIRRKNQGAWKRA